MTNKDIEECILSDARFKESRLKSLYSNFDHLKESNIDGYNANILSWKWLILQLIKKEVFKHTLYINTSDLILDLSLPSKNLQPHGLDKVLNVMINENKILLTYDQFANNDNDAISKIGYLKSFIPWFGSNQDKYIDIGISNNSGSGELKENIKLISRSQVDKYSELIFTYLEDNMKCDTPFLKTHIEEKCLIEFNKKLDNFEIKCCLLNLIKQGKITKEIKDSIEIIWINYKKNKEKDTDENEEILNFEELQSICELKYSIFKINNHNKILNKRINEIKFKIIENLKKDNEIDKKLIKSKLKIKLLLEKSIINSNNFLENLETTLINIENSKNNQFTKITLEKNSKILKNLNNKIGNIKEIDLLINEINIENDKVIEISDKLSNITNKESTNIEIDKEDLEIENELKQLEIDELNKQDLDDDKLMERFNKLKLNSNKSTESIEKDSNKDKIVEDLNKSKIMEIAN